MKPLLNQIFVVLGVLFLIQIIAMIFFFIADPYNLKPMLFGSGSAFSLPGRGGGGDGGGGDGGGGATTGTGFALSDGQKQALINLGIDPSMVPASVTAEQENCFIDVLGEARVNEIKGGAVPNNLEFARAKSCI